MTGPLVIRGKLASQYLILIFHIVDFYVLGNNHFLIWGGWDFFEKNISMPKLTEKQFRFCIVAEK
jgi:hypothetical protein